jgi:hypothetical protein
MAPHALLLLGGGETVIGSAGLFEPAAPEGSVFRLSTEATASASVA